MRIIYKSSEMKQTTYYTKNIKSDTLTILNTDYLKVRAAHEKMSFVNEMKLNCLYKVCYPLQEMKIESEISPLPNEQHLTTVGVVSAAGATATPTVTSGARGGRLLVP